MHLHGARPRTLPHRTRFQGLGHAESRRTRRKERVLIGQRPGARKEISGLGGPGIRLCLGRSATGARHQERRRQGSQAPDEHCGASVSPRSSARGILGGREEHHVSEPQVTVQPIYADRSTGQTFPNARAMIDAYLARFGERAGSKLEALDTSGYTLVRKGSASVGINVLEDHGVLLFVAPVMPLPATGRETLYRRLLELSFLSTADGAFAIDAHREEVVVRALRRLSGLDYEEFEDLLETVGKVADSWDDPLRAEFGR